MKIGSNAILINVPRAIMPIALFISPSPRITIFADCVKLTNIDPKNNTLKYLTPNSLISPQAPTKSSLRFLCLLFPMLLIKQKHSQRQAKQMSRQFHLNLLLHTNWQSSKQLLYFSCLSRFYTNLPASSVFHDFLVVLFSRYLKPKSDRRFVWQKAYEQS